MCVLGLEMMFSDIADRGYNPWTIFPGPDFVISNIVFFHSRISMFSFCGGLKENSSKESNTIRRCGLVGESVLWWVRVLRCFSQVPFSVTVSWLPAAFWSRCSQHHTCLCTVIFPVMMIMDWTSETVSKPLLLNVFFVRVAVLSLYVALVVLELSV